jgi:hypothetical protein
VEDSRHRKRPESVHSNDYARVTGNSEVMAEDGDPVSASKSASDRQHVPIGLGAMFTRNTIVPIEVVACATVLLELVQSHSTNREFAARRGAAR